VIDEEGPKSLAEVDFILPSIGFTNMAPISIGMATKASLYVLLMKNIQSMAGNPDLPQRKICGHENSFHGLKSHSENSDVNAAGADGEEIDSASSG
jgi:hypothetical protein